ncbi:MAG: DUF4388 domain-containing protein [Candidatus Goldiibacteriota bacterium]
MRGTINSISVAGMLRLLCSYGKTGILNIDSGRIKGFVEINSGEISDVSVEKSMGRARDKKEALVQLLLAIDEGSFYFEEKHLKSKPPLGLCVEGLIIESAREIYTSYKDEINVKDIIFPENEVLRMASLPREKKITINMTYEEWNLLAGFNGDNNIAAAYDAAGIEKAKAEIILYGLVSAALLRRLRFKIPELARIARENLGNIGSAIVDSEFAKQKIDRTKMGMRSFLSLLNALEESFAEILGRTRAREIIEKIWAATK